MRVLVTGGYGFIGSFVAEKFFQEGCEVTIIDDLSTGNKSNLDIKHHSYIHSVEDRNCEEIFRSHRFDVVVHLAAQINVLKSIENPRLDVKTNVLGLTNMLSLARKYGVKKFIFASSAAVYGNNEELPLTEGSACEPISPYGMSKLVGEMYCRKWTELYGLETLCFRFSNVYGPRQGSIGEGGVVSTFMERALAGKELQLHGSGEQTRDFIFVEDVAHAIYRASYTDLTGVYNLSTKTRTSVNRLIEELSDAHGQVKIARKDRRQGDIEHSCLDNSKIGRDLDWAPKYSISDGIAKTYEWFASDSRKAEPDASGEPRQTSWLIRMLKIALPYAENAIVFGLTAWLTLMLSNTMYDFIDLKMLYIIVMGIAYGNRQSILAVAMSTGLYVYQQTSNGHELLSILYDTDFFFLIAVYLFIGLIVGYAIERKNSALKTAKRRLEALDEKHAFLNNVYNETRLVKEELQQQIMNNGDSFGKIYSVTKELESLEPEKIFASTVSVVESIMKSKSVAIYTVNRYQSYLRLIANSNGTDFAAAKSLKTEEHPYIAEVLADKKMFVNKELRGDVPLLAAPVLNNGEAIAVIVLNGMPFENFTLYYQNLFKITIELVSSALSRALSFVEATGNQRYVEGTSIMLPEVFAEIFDSKKLAFSKHGVEYSLLTFDPDGDNRLTLQEAAEVASRSLRETDYIGLGEDGRLLVLLSNSNKEEAQFVLDRFKQNGVHMMLAGEDLRDVV